jgi:hypothetical protein
MGNWYKYCWHLNLFICEYDYIIEEMIISKQFEWAKLLLLSLYYTYLVFMFLNLSHLWIFLIAAIGLFCITGIFVEFSFK